MKNHEDPPQKKCLTTRVVLMVFAILLGGLRRHAGKSIRCEA